jgi:hypothetical protein
MFSEPLLALMMVLALLAVLRFRRTGQMRWMAASGAAAGAAVLVRDDSLFLVLVPFTIYAAAVSLRRNPNWAWRLQSALAWAAPIGAAGLLALVYHLVRFGWGSGPYGHDGMGFTQPLLGGLYGLLLSPGAGLLVFVPVLALAFFGFPEFFGRWRAEAALIAVLVVLRLLFFARWWDWQGGATWGPRYLVPLVPLMLVPVAFLPAGWWRKAALALGAVGVGIELLDQLVPYGLYYGAIVPQLAARLGICACVPGPGQGSRDIHNIMAFDWHYAPLVGQLNDLLHGIVAPAWAPIALLALPLLAIASVGLGLQIWRLAHRLEAVEIAEAA